MPTIQWYPLRSCNHRMYRGRRDATARNETDGRMNVRVEDRRRVTDAHRRPIASSVTTRERSIFIQQSTEKKIKKQMADIQAPLFMRHWAAVVCRVTSRRARLFFHELFLRTMDGTVNFGKLCIKFGRNNCYLENCPPMRDYFDN